MMTLRGRVVLPNEVLDDGVVQVRDGHITAVGPAGDFPEGGIPDPTDELILPGLIDLHSHGGGGASFADAVSPTDVLAAVAAHRRRGTTTVVASLVTATPDALRTRTSLLAPLAADGHIAGIHYEGPFLSPARCGAQDPAAIAAPDPQLTGELLGLARGHAVSMTLAPELPGAAAVATVLLEHGALPSWGHTSATAHETRAAVDAVDAVARARGRRATVTHLYNGMPPVHHRDPGPVLEFLAAARRGRLVVELIGDGVHLDPATVRATIEVVGRDNAVLVTDSMAAAGMPDGEYVLGGRAVSVRDGVARLSGDGTLAGGTAFLLDVVRTSVAGGVPLVDAVHLAATGPAAVLGRTDIGSLAVDAAADIVVTDADLTVRRVYRHGVAVA